MKKLFVFAVLTALSSVTGFGAQQTWTGKISDAMCGADHSMMQKGTTKMSDKQCVEACVKSGQKYVLVSNSKVYQISNQNFAGLAAHAGDSVTVTGDASQDGKSIAVTKIDGKASARTKGTSKMDPNMKM